MVGQSTGWQADGSIATITPPPNGGPVYGPIDPYLPLWEIQLRVDHLYKNNSNQTVNEGDTIVYRAFDLLEGECPSTGLIGTVNITGTVGDELLYAMVLNDDGDTWTPGFASWGRFRMDGPVVTDTNCPPGLVSWEPDNETLDPDTFRSHIEAAVGWP
jgi:hypothetical protein